MDFSNEPKRPWKESSQFNRTTRNFLPLIQKCDYSKYLNISLREEKSISLPYLNGSISARSISKKSFHSRQRSLKTLKKDRFPMKPDEFLFHYQSMLSAGEKEEIQQCYLISYYPLERQNSFRKNLNWMTDDQYEFECEDHINYRYEMIQLLGRGSFGIVIGCFDHRDQQYCALKILTKRNDFANQAQVEVKILNHLKEFHSPFLVQMKESFYFRSHLCISFELLGKSLYQLMVKNHHQGFSLQLTKRFVHSILQALSLLSRENLIHCDLKPENILLKEKGSSAIKLIDFGSSSFQSQIIYTYIQSRYYRAPEILLGIGYTTAIDIWSLGCIAVELYTGHPLFPGENEQDQFSLMIELLDYPPKSLLEKAKRKKIFFNSKGILRSLSEKWLKRRSPASRSLEEILRTNNEDFVHFVGQCLKWNPDERLSAREGLEHRFFLG